MFQVVFVDLKPDPIDFFGIATITRSPSDSKNGPWFYVDARKNPPFIEVSTFAITKKDQIIQKTSAFTQTNERGGLVSKETVVLRRWAILQDNYFLSAELIM